MLLAILMNSSQCLQGMGNHPMSRPTPTPTPDSGRKITVNLITSRGVRKFVGVLRNKDDDTSTRIEITTEADGTCKIEFGEKKCGHYEFLLRPLPPSVQYNLDIPNTTTDEVVRMKIAD
jgi:hypothetical protein